MKKTVIFGTNELSELLGWYLEIDDRYDFVGYTLDDEYCKAEIFADKSIIPFSKLKEHFSANDLEILVTIGYSKMNDSRKLVFEKITAAGYNIAEYVHPSAVVCCKVKGKGNIILENCVLGPYSTLGDGNILYSSTTIAHHCVVGSFNFFSIECAVAGCVNIHNNCFFGVNCTIRDNVQILPYTLIGAGAYIAENTEENSVYVPARSVKLNKNSRDIKL